MFIANEDLRYGATAASSHPLCARLGALINIDCLVRKTFTFEQPTGPCAIRAPIRQIHNDFRLCHEVRGSLIQAFCNGRFSARQALIPPRRLNALVKPCAVSWRTAAAPSEPVSS